MAGTLTHVFVSTHTESGSSIGLVSANEWNSSHAFSGTWDSSQLTSLNSSQIAGTVLSSQIASLGSSQLTGTLLSSQGGTGNTTLGATGNLVFTSAGVLTAISGSSFNGSNQLALTSMNMLVNGEIVNTSIDLQIHQGLGGL